MGRAVECICLQGECSCHIRFFLHYICYMLLMDMKTKFNKYLQGKYCLAVNSKRYRPVAHDPPKDDDVPTLSPSLLSTPTIVPPTDKMSPYVNRTSLLDPPKPKPVRDLGLDFGASSSNTEAIGDRSVLSRDVVERDVLGTYIKHTGREAVAMGQQYRDLPKVSLLVSF